MNYNLSRRFPVALMSPRLLHAVLLTILFLCLTNLSARAGSATWNSDSSHYWSLPANWNPQTKPDGPDDVATFAVSDQTVLWLDFSTEVNSVVFQPGASGYTLSGLDGSTFSFTGAGVINQSGQLQNFYAASNEDNEGQNSFEFSHSASAGELTQFALDGLPGPDAYGGLLVFRDSSTAGAALINNLGDGGHHDNSYGYTVFLDASSAQHATITNSHGILSFRDNSSAGQALIINEGATIEKGHVGITDFSGRASTGDSTIICNNTANGDLGGILSFHGDIGPGGSVIRGRARVILHGNGRMFVSPFPYTVQAAVGSIEGDGNVFLGDPVVDQLEIGTNNRSTIFAGKIQDSPDVSGGTFSKVGAGNLTLTGVSSYTGETTVKGGQLTINNSTGSGTGTGAVLVKGGTLSGKGTIAGAVTVGRGNGGGATAVLAPSLGSPKPVTLTIKSTLAFAKNGTYSYRVDSRHAQADQVIANGVTIDPGAQFAASDARAAVFPPGTVLIVIQNTGATSIAGAFGNLADGSTITIGNNSFVADYQGGDGNDLTLSVLP